MQLLWLPAIQEQLALNEKNPASALNIQEAAYPMELGQTSLNNISCLYPAYVRGNADLAAGQGGVAAAEFQKLLDHSGIVWNCWTGALAHLGVARANALQAHTSQGADADAARLRALAAYKDFLNLWKDADPEIPKMCIRDRNSTASQAATWGASAPVTAYKQRPWSMKPTYA